MRKKTAHVTIDLDDVRSAGGVKQALAAWCEDSDDTSCGIVGPSFSTSGPGSGWSVQHNENDYARRAFTEGALHYLDVDDGKLMSVAEATEDERDKDGNLPDDVLTDIGGCVYRIGEWTDESVVRIECPEMDDAMAVPKLVAEMASAVIAHHHAASDCNAWRTLIAQIREAAEALENIDLDDFPENDE